MKNIFAGPEVIFPLSVWNMDYAFARMKPHYFAYILEQWLEYQIPFIGKN